MTLRMFCIITIMLAACPASSANYPYKTPDDFKSLSAYTTIGEFEQTIEKYTQHCLDNTGGGTGGVPCFIANTLWNRELNTYYSNLMRVLKGKRKKLLKESQQAWLKELSKTKEFNSCLTETHEECSTGTMGVLMKAGDIDRTITPVVKQRALLLKEWWEFVKSKNK